MTTEDLYDTDFTMQFDESDHFILKLAPDSFEFAPEMFDGRSDADGVITAVFAQRLVPCPDGAGLGAEAAGLIPDTEWKTLVARRPALTEMQERFSRYPQSGFPCRAVLEPSQAEELSLC